MGDHFCSATRSVSLSGIHLFCVGLSHHTANVETRERYARGSELEAGLLAATGFREALVLSTCNRVELYAVA
ncbi:MAG: hypothetical protein ABI992_11335, partial [Chthoniobacterales bacterium]